MTLVPEAKLGIAILTNAESSRAMTRCSTACWTNTWAWRRPTGSAATADGRARRTRRNWRALKGAAGKRAAKSQPSLALAAYDGEYQDAWYGKVTIKPEGGKHVLSFSRTPDLTGELEHFQHDTFIVRWKERNFNADAYVTFALNPDGSIERMKMAPVSTETDFSYDFADLTFVPVKPPAKRSKRVLTVTSFAPPINPGSGPPDLTPAVGPGR